MKPAWGISLLLAALAFVGTTPLGAQGVTTAAIAGVVTDSSGAPLEAARVGAAHGPSGTTYAAVTRADGTYFNNSFGLQGQPGDRTGVAPVSLDAIQQLQVNVAPYDVRQGNFVGAGINMVTKSGTNDVSGSLYYNARSNSFVGTHAGPNTFNPGTFKYHDIGAALGGPIIRNRLFFFGSFEHDGQTAPGTTYLANDGSQPVGGNVTR